MDEYDPHAPQFLDKLLPLVNNAANNFQGLSERRKKVPTKRCVVCRTCFAYEMLSTTPDLRRDICDSCKRHLIEGYTAILDPDGSRYAWVSFKKPTGDTRKLEGKVVPVKTSEDFQKILTHAGIESHPTIPDDPDPAP